MVPKWLNKNHENNAQRLIALTIQMTLSDLQSHPPIASLFKWDFSYSCSAFDKISTDIVSRDPFAVAELFSPLLLTCGIHLCSVCSRRSHSACMMTDDDDIYKVAQKPQRL